MSQAPHSLELGRAVGIVEAIGRPDVFGLGTLDSPLFPVTVQLSRGDGNIYAITSRISAAVKSHLREVNLERRFRNDLLMAVRRELWSSTSYDELLQRAMKLVHAI